MLYEVITKKYLAVNSIKMYIINATMIAEEIGLGNRTNTIMQSAFFKIANVIPYELVITSYSIHYTKLYETRLTSHCTSLSLTLFLWYPENMA